jgi:hypothetical protein
MEITRGRSRVLLVSVIVAAAFVGGVAHAQVAQPGISNEMRAEYLFREGEKKFDSGRYAEACQDWNESLRLGPKLGTLLNLALCHETVGRVATAWSEYHHGAAWAAQNGQKDRHDFALQHAVLLENKLPRVLLQLPADRALETVEVDGEPLPDSRWYLPVFLDPGEHTVSITAPGKHRGSVKFRVTNSPTEQLVSVPPLTDELPPTPPPIRPPMPSSDPDAQRRLAGLVTMGAGAVGLAVGITFGILAIDKRRDIGSQCSGRTCTPDGADAYRSAQDRATVATVATLVGVGAGAVGAWLFFTSRPPQVHPSERPASERGGEPLNKPSVGLGLRGRPDGGDISVGGVF